MANLPSKKAARSKPPQPSVRISTNSVNPSSNKSKKSHKVDSNNNQIIEQELHQRLDKNKAKIGKLNFSLRWWDPNDLDLHVICPCGSEIYYLYKKCPTCKGELDIDMNTYNSMSLEPVEHVYFNNPKPGLYKFFVKYFNGPKEHLGVHGK